MVARRSSLPLAAGALDALAALTRWLLSLLKLAWNTVVDVPCLFVMVAFAAGRCDLEVYLHLIVQYAGVCPP